MRQLYLVLKGWMFNEKMPLVSLLSSSPLFLLSLMNDESKWKSLPSLLWIISFRTLFSTSPRQRQQCPPFLCWSSFCWLILLVVVAFKSIGHPSAIQHQHLAGAFSLFCMWPRDLKICAICSCASISLQDFNVLINISLSHVQATFNNNRKHQQHYNSKSHQ